MGEEIGLFVLLSKETEEWMEEREVREWRRGWTRLVAGIHSYTHTLIHSIVCIVAIVVAKKS